MTEQTETDNDAASQALSDAGAQCGECDDQPGDRTCPGCESCYAEYVTALRAAGWAPRAEVLREAADRLSGACLHHNPDLDEGWPDCPCEYADDIRNVTPGGAT